MTDPSRSDIYTFKSFYAQYIDIQKSYLNGIELFALNLDQ